MVLIHFFKLTYFSFILAVAYTINESISILKKKSILLK